MAIERDGSQQTVRVVTSPSVLLTVLGMTAIGLVTYYNNQTSIQLSLSAIESSVAAIQQRLSDDHDQERADIARMQQDIADLRMERQAAEPPRHASSAALPPGLIVAH